MTKFALTFLLFSTHVMAYVPTVESLFRNGGNPDVTSNAVSLTLKVKKAQAGVENSGGVLQDVSLIKERRVEDFYKIFYNKPSGENLKIGQTRYSNNTFSETSLEHKIYYSNFTPYTIKPSIEQMEKGLFFSILNSVIFNDGIHLVNYLKALGVPVRLNNELINREKVEYLAAYKRYLIITGKDRNAKKTEPNPLRPDDSGSREKVERIMNESMYVDTKQVKLVRDSGEMAWMVSAPPFEAVVSYQKRQVQWVKYKGQTGEFDISFHDYWLANGTHYMPKNITVKNFDGEVYHVELSSFRHSTEGESEVSKRLQKWDEILRGKESLDPRPEFLL